MTRINLIPADMRRAEATPLRVLIPILVSVLLVVCATFSWAFIHFGTLSTSRADFESAKAELAAVEPGRKYVESLKDELAEFKNREKTIKSIASSRVLWTRKLDQLLDVTTDDNSGQDFLLWLDSVEVRQPQASQGPKGRSDGETVRVVGWCFAEKNPLENFNTFHRKLRQSPFYEDFADMPNPAGKTEEFDGALRPKTAWTVDLMLPMKARDEKKSAGRPGALAEQDTKQKPAPR